MSAHDCPAPGCTASVPWNMLACQTHWYMIPKALRDELWRAYRVDGQFSGPHMAAIEACCSWLEQNVGSHA